MSIRYLHLSDLHLTGQHKNEHGWAVDQFNQDMVTCSMLEFISQLVEKQGKAFDMVFITGDLAKCGKPDDYAVVEVFCDRLLKATGVLPARLFFVPGNHDVDRGKVDMHDLAFETEDEVTGILGLPERYRALTLKLDSFYKFAERTMGRSLYGNDNCYFVEPVSISAGNQTILINVMGLNSALFAGYDNDDKQKLAFGLPQINGACSLLNKQALLTIALFHHPFGCFHHVDRVCRNLLMKDADLILTGHLHEPENMWVRGAVGQSILIGAGSSFETRESENSFNVVEINLANGAGKIQFYKYLPRYNRWKEDTDANPEDIQGIFSFEIKRLKPADDVASANTGILLLKELIVKMPAVADAVSRSKEVIENSYRQMDRLKLSKKIHDALHTIEFDCLRIMQAGGPETRLRPFEREFVRQTKQIHEAIQEGNLIVGFRDDLLDQLEEIAKAFKAAIDPPLEPSKKETAFKKVVSELTILLSLYPSKLDSDISNAAGELNLDRLLELMTTVRNLLPAASPGHELELELFIKGMDALNRLRGELAGRISEHTKLQSLDSKLRTVCVEETPLRGVGIEWGRIKVVRLRLAPPFSPELKAMNEELVALESEIDIAVERGEDKAARDLLREEYFRLVSSAFRNVDSDLKEFCLRLSDARQPLETILRMC